MIYIMNFFTVREENKMINYENMIDLDNVTLVDCLDLYEKKDMCTELNDGRIINFVKEDDK